jgi:MFS family permease
MGNITNGVLYGIFAFSSVLAGSMLNILGPRTMLLFSCTGYPVFNGAMWYFSSTGHLWYPIFAGAYLGLAAGCLWTTAVFMCVGYPEEKDKGRWRAIGWTGNLIGSTIGASVALGIAWHSSTDSVPSSLYITFIVLQVFSLAFALLIQPPEKLRRCDGTAIARFNPISIKETLKLTAELFRDWRIWLLVPAMFTPEMSFPFQATMNGYAFNIRTRTLNSLLNGLVQIPVVALVGWILDRQSLGTRRKRLLIAITFVAVWLTGTYIAQTAWLAAWKFDLSVPGPQIDCTDPAYAGAVVVYLLYAAQYGGFQSVVLYTLSCFTNDPQKSAAIGGLYVGSKSGVFCNQLAQHK